MSFGKAFLIKFVLYLPKWAGGDKNDDYCSTLYQVDCNTSIMAAWLPACSVIRLSVLTARRAIASDAFIPHSFSTGLRAPSAMAVACKITIKYILLSKSHILCKIHHDHADYTW